MKLASLTLAAILGCSSMAVAQPIPSMPQEAFASSDLTLVTYPCERGYHMTRHGYCARWQGAYNPLPQKPHYVYRNGRWVPNAPQRPRYNRYYR